MKKNLKYVLIFVIGFFSISFLFFSFSIDIYANFGFSYALSIGLVPYKEFNLVVPLFAQLLY